MTVISNIVIRELWLSVDPPQINNTNPKRLRNITTTLTILNPIFNFVSLRILHHPILQRHLQASVNKKKLPVYNDRFNAKLRRVCNFDETRDAVVKRRWLIEVEYGEKVGRKTLGELLQLVFN